MNKPVPTDPEKRSLFRQLRPLVVFCGVTLIALSIGVTLAAQGLMGSFGKVERDATRQKAEQVYRAFEADLRQLAISNRDYAEWDDAQQFMVMRDQGFIDGNFSADTLSEMHVDLVWIVDREGRNVYSSLVNRATRKAVTPAPSAILNEFRLFQTRDKSLRERAPGERTVLTSRGLAAASAIEITRSDHSNGTGAVMLFARFIEERDIQRVKETSRLPVSMIYLASPSAHETALPPQVRSWARSARASASTYVRAVDDGHITGYSLIQDVNHRSVAVFSTEVPRDIFALGARTTWYLLASVVALFLAFGATALGLILRLLKLQKLDFEHRERAHAQQRMNRKSLAKQAQQDALTGLPNRLYLNSRLPRLLRRMTDSKRLLAVVYLDLDQFKNVNDSRGHGCGDLLLQIVAKRLRAVVSAHDVVARLGGDEFVIIASLLPDLEAVERFAERLRAAVTADMMVEKQPVTVTASLGIAVYPRDGVDVESLFKHADIALYQAKEAGRNCHRFFAADMDARISEHAVLEQALRQALGTRQLYMEYQPIVDLQDGRVVSMEALMRWRHPEMGMIPPSRFIPVAEKCGLVLEIGQHALREVLQQQRAWLDADVPIVPIAVNVSPMQIERMDFAAAVIRLAAAIDVEPKWVRFEITESAMMKEPEKLVGTLRTLRELGCQVLIDDFGTGYSSLSYLDRLPVDILKIDRAFVRDLDRAEGRSPIIDAVIDMAKRLGLKTVAEGVETAAQGMALRERGCDYAQGFFYSKPVSAQHCRSLLEHLKRERPLTETMVLRVIGDR